VKRAVASSIVLYLASTACAEPGPAPAPSSPTGVGTLAAPDAAMTPDAATHDAATHDGAATDAAAQTHSDASRPRCGSGPWPSYAHDPARTSASDGCVEGPLRVAARFTPRGPCGYKSRFGRVQHAVSDGDGVFASGDCGGAPAVWRVDASGASVWTMSRADYSRASWPAIAGDSVVSTDDGVFLIDRATGKWRGRELDVWGEAIVSGDHFYVDNTWQLDGAGPFVARFDATLHWVWKASRFDGARGKDIADVGGIALANGLVVDAAVAGPRGAPLLSAHDADSGDRKWSAKGSWPESAPSIADGRVHVIERWDGEKDDRLVARGLSTGDIAWSQKVGWARGTPPALTPRLVIVHARDALTAFDRTNGAPAWSVPVPRTTPLVQSMTTLAVALGSGTVVVTSGARVIVLRLDDGKEIWSDAVVTGHGAVVGSPIVVGRTVHVVIRTLTNMGTLVRLEPS
jgi:outer membrane protein assembly factor BamB